MTHKKMKASIIKVIVECTLKDVVELKEFDVDSEIFDDVLLEAATRFVEQHIKKPGAKISPILTCYEKNDQKNYDKYFCFNSYYIIIYAGFHKKAEIMRNNFKNQTKIDLKNESVKSKK